jgi:hypothetical protein
MWNCEHFVKCCRYGHGESYQTEMITSLIAWLSFAGALLSWFQFPAWISLNIAWMIVVGYYGGLYFWRLYENIVVVFMRKHRIPMSVISATQCFEKLTYLEWYFVLMFWMFQLGLRLIATFLVIQFWGIDLYPNFSIFYAYGSI